jgi:hypothetical protein
MSRCWLLRLLFVLALGLIRPAAADTAISLDGGADTLDLSAAAALWYDASGQRTLADWQQFAGGPQRRGFFLDRGNATAAGASPGRPVAGRALAECAGAAAAHPGGGARAVGTH